MILILEGGHAHFAYSETPYAFRTEKSMISSDVFHCDILEGFLII
jgi:hypothetical protein